jgi:hypothetical protein
MMVKSVGIKAPFMLHEILPSRRHRLTKHNFSVPLPPILRGPFGRFEHLQKLSSLLVLPFKIGFGWRIGCKKEVGIIAAIALYA